MSFKTLEVSDVGRLAARSDQSAALPAEEEAIENLSREQARSIKLR
jgi:hypothetical protein